MFVCPQYIGLFSACQQAIPEKFAACKQRRLVYNQGMGIYDVIERHLDGQPLREIERQTGVPASSLSSFLHGRRGLSVESIDRLLDHFKLEVRPRKTRRQAAKPG